MENNQNNILQKIRADEVRMRPRGYFLAKGIALVVVAALVLILSALFLSFIIFSLRVSGEFSLLDYGSAGWLDFLVLFPWFILLIDVALLIVLEWLLRQFHFGYRTPLAYLGLGTLVLAFFFSVLINATPLHVSLMERADQNDLPMIGAMYQGLREPLPARGIFRGIVTATTTDGRTLVIEEETATGTSDVSWTVVPLSPGMISTFSVGDEIFIAGSSTFDINATGTTIGGPIDEIHAFGISKINPSY